jgi:hypothetical protein
MLKHRRCYMVNDAETQKLLHSPWYTMPKHRSCYMVDDDETQKMLHSPWLTMLKHKRCYTVHRNNVETQRKPLHSPGPTMLKHKGSCYKVCGQKKLTQIDIQLHCKPSTNHRYYMRNDETIKSANTVAETTRDLRCRNNM